MDGLKLFHLLGDFDEILKTGDVKQRLSFQYQRQIAAPDDDATAGRAHFNLGIAHRLGDATEKVIGLDVGSHGHRTTKYTTCRRSYPCAGARHEGLTGMALPATHGRQHFQPAHDVENPLNARADGNFVEAQRFPGLI